MQEKQPEMTPEMAKTAQAVLLFANTVGLVRDETNRAERKRIMRKMYLTAAEPILRWLRAWHSANYQGQVIDLDLTEHMKVRISVDFHHIFSIHFQQVIEGSDSMQEAVFECHPIRNGVLDGDHNKFSQKWSPPSTKRLAAKFQVISIGEWFNYLVALYTLILVNYPVPEEEVRNLPHRQVHIPIGKRFSKP